MTIWLTADMHFGHQNIITYCNRPFADVDEMNEALISNWNETVKDNDKVIVVGDACMGKIADTLPLISQLKGRKKLIPGNHDRCWPHQKKGAEKWKIKYEEVGFEVWPLAVEMDNRFLLCHFPYEGDSHTEDRYADLRPKRKGHKALIHGHVHDSWQINGDQINVGVDVWDFTPVSFDRIVAIREEMQ